jgi:hypothetical protein
MKINRHVYLIIGLILTAIALYLDFIVNTIHLLALFYWGGGWFFGVWIRSFFKPKIS